MFCGMTADVRGSRDILRKSQGKSLALGFLAAMSAWGSNGGRKIRGKVQGKKKKKKRKKASERFTPLIVHTFCV